MVASGHCSSDQGTIVLGTVHPCSKSWALLGSILGLNRPDGQRVGRRKLCSWENLYCSPGGPCSGVCTPTSFPAQRPVCEMRKCSGFLSHLFICCICLSLMMFLGPILPFFLLLSQLVVVIAEGYGTLGANLCVRGVGRGDSRRK